MEKIGRLIHKIIEDQIRQSLKETDTLFVIGYSGLSSSQMNVLRQSLRQSKSNLFVIKNSIAKRAFDDIGLKELSGMLQGPCGLIFIKDDPIATSKVIYNFAKEYQSLKIEGGILKNKILHKTDIMTLATLPNKKMLYTKIAIGIKAPIYNLVGVLNNTLKKLVILLEQIKNKKKTKEGGENGREENR